MLRNLHIEHYVLIDSLDIDFPEGLVIITGQTGAGKSILLGALSLLTGARADASVIAEGAQNCVVEGEFDVSGIDTERISAILEDSDVEFDGASLILRRVLNAGGRSRSFVNDSPVHVQVLADLAGCLVDIHSQHQSLLLSDRTFQLSLLDSYAGASALRAQAAGRWKALKAAEREFAEVSGRKALIDRDREYNQAQFEQLDKAALRSGELEELEEEQKQLANAEEIKTCFGGALERLDPSNGEGSVAAALKEAGRLLEKAARFVPDAADLASRMESSRIEIEDILSDIESVDSKVNLSEERLAVVEERLALIYQLLRKHGEPDIDGLLALKDRLSEALFDSSALEYKLDSLKHDIEESRKQLDAVCKELSAKRSAAAPELASEVQAMVRGLELDKAVFAVEVAAAQEPGPTGADAVSYRFSSNGTAPADISKCASGGEMSRIMLCLKALMARFVGMPTIIFDEIDTGVSGSAAHKMGNMICSMGENMQVFAITHLPQVAAKGNAHYVVRKADDASGRTISTISLVDGPERVDEIARLLSGATITPEARANAKSLLGL